MYILIAAVVAALVSTGGTIYYLKNIKKWTDINDIPEDTVLKSAEGKIKEKLQAAEQEADALKKQAEERAKTVRKETSEHEELLIEREKKINKRSKILDDKADELNAIQDRVKSLQKGVETTRTRLETELEKITGLTKEEAKTKLMAEVEEGMKDYEASLIRKAEKKAEEISDEKAKHILVDAMQKVATDYVRETTTSTIKIDDEKVKGSIIGKEGRNIRAFEKATGVDVIVDEAPNTIGLSSFDSLRREIAKVALTKLIADGRIHPGSIEEAIRKAKNEIAQEIKKNGYILAEEAGWPGIDIGLVKLLGKMKYRSSYGQSLMAHTIEVTRLGAALAAELNLDVALVMKACLLHDVGKVLTHKVESPHHHISGQIARKYGLEDKLVNAIEAHHLDIEPQSPEAIVVYLADALSGARPGARKDSYEQYIQRIEALEKAAKEIGGDKIDEVFAIRAGREVRVIVKPEVTSDEEIKILAKKIVQNIEKTQNYPGNVEVSVIREFRAVETAK
jgi:ribonuclease Y